MSEPADLSPVQRAEELFGQGYNCAQAVVFAFSDRLGSDGDAVLRIASGFGGGIGHRQETCGAVTGAIIVMGSRHGRALDEPKARTDATYALAGQFMCRFEACHGTCKCRELLGGCDLNTAAGEREFKELGYREARCAAFIREAVRIVEELEHDPGCRVQTICSPPL
jgi:C_GCAxxG_C_C family probable redox protein